MRAAVGQIAPTIASMLVARGRRPFGIVLGFTVRAAVAGALVGLRLLFQAGLR